MLAAAPLAAGSVLVWTLALGLAGAVLGCVLAVALRPGFGVDALGYHLPDVLGWLRSGHAGSVLRLNYDVPYGYYPITNEVPLTWTLGISRSFAPLAIWSPVLAALALLALWSLLGRRGLRSRRCRSSSRGSTWPARGPTCRR